MPGVSWGIIGCGDVTEVKSGPGFAKAEGSALVAVMRRDGRLAADYARRHGVPRWYDDADALLADPAVDAVYIATPPDSHRALTEAAARAGKPVLVEKPIARDAVEGQAMIDACRRAGVPLWVAYYRRAMPRFERVRTLIAEGRIGTPRAVMIRHTQPAPDDGTGAAWRVRPEIGGGGHFVDTGCHILDWLDHLFGPILRIDGLAANRGGRHAAEDTVTASIGFASGVQGIGLWSFAAGPAEERTTIIGTGGELSVSLFSPTPVVIATPAGVETLDLPFPDHVHQPLIQTVVDELLGRGRCPSTGDSALRTTAAIDALLAGFRAAMGGAAIAGRDRTV